MKTSLRAAALSVLPVLLLVAACGDDSTAPDEEAPVPSVLVKTGGDGQFGVPGSTLPTPLEVTVRDQFGEPVSGFSVTFTASAGSVAPGSGVSGSDGTAATTLTLPDAEQQVTVEAAGVGLDPVTFTATAEAEQLSIVTSALPAGRLTLGYDAALEVSGGSGAGYTFAVASGALPDGLELSEDGSVSGVPTSEGDFDVTIRVTDDESNEVARSFSIEVCDVPGSMAVGDVRVVEPAAPGSCGVFIPAGAAGDRYRVGVVRTSSAISAGDVGTARVVVTGYGVTSEPLPAPLRTAVGTRPGERIPLPEGFEEARRFMEERHRAHLALREREGRLRPGLDAAERQAVRDLGLVDRPLGAQLPDRIRADTATSSCQATGVGPATFFKIAENDRFAFYQDSAQAQGGQAVSESAVQEMTDVYERYGDKIIQDYFGGVSDIDGNGKVIVLVTPAARGGVAAFVWAGDFLDPDTECAPSNQGEYIYFNPALINALDDPDAGAPFVHEVFVHEMKHVASLNQRIQRWRDQGAPNQIPLHPGFIEEGVAEVAGVMFARNAWAAIGGPAPNATVTEDSWRGFQDQDGNTVNGLNVGVLLLLLRTQGFLSTQPNAVTVVPEGAGSNHDIYGAGWTFHRWLGDAYGNAAVSPFADAQLFSRLNDKETAEGIAGITAITGNAWPALMEEWAAAAMTNGQTVAQPLRAYTSYDFVSAIEMWCFAVDPGAFDNSSCSQQQGAEPGPPGAFPWPVTTDDLGTSESVGLESAVIEGPIGGAGLRVHEFVSNGSGDGADVNVAVPGPASVVVVRLQ